MLVIAEHFADDPGVAMVERAHGVEGMRGVPRSGLHRILCDRHLSVGVPDAYADLPPGSLGNHFHGAGNFRSNRQHAHVPARRLPKTVEDFTRRRDQIFRRMHSPPLVAEKRSLEMNAQRASLHGIAIRRGGGCLDRVGQIVPAPHKSRRVAPRPWSENIRSRRESSGICPGAEVPTARPA